MRKVLLFLVLGLTFTGLIAQDLPEISHEILADSTIRFDITQPYYGVDSLVIHNREDEPYNSEYAWNNASIEVSLDKDSVSVIFTPKHKNQNERLFNFSFYKQGVCVGSKEMIVESQTGVEKFKNGLVVDYSLSQNYPNPFNPETTIEFNLPKSEVVTLEICNLLGKKVTTLINKKMSQGNHSINFNGNGLPSGVYLYRLQTDNYVKTKRMVLMK